MPGTGEASVNARGWVGEPSDGEAIDAPEPEPCDEDEGD